VFDIAKKYRLTIEGRGNIDIGPAEYVTSGGEGHIYRPAAGSLALKVWDDPTRAATGRMAERIRLLSEIKHPNVIAPEALVYDRSGRQVGYVMPWATGWDLPLAFTNDWRAAHKFNDADAALFSERMRQVVVHAHALNIIQGDSNELNIIGISNAPHYIDVDAWLPAGFRGDKIMPTVRDWHAAPFSREADWFVWAVVTFQLRIGVHPYRGTHPDFKRGDLDGRMRANASVFEPAIKLNTAARPFSVFDRAMADWYRAVFRDGLRTPPPALGRTLSFVQAKMPINPISSGRLMIVEAFRIQSPFICMATPGIMLLADGSLVSILNGRKIAIDIGSDAFMQIAPGVVLGMAINAGSVYVGQSDTGIAATTLWAPHNRLFAVVRDGLLELQPRNLGQRQALLPGKKWAISPDATFFGNGVALLNALGAKYIVLPQAGTALPIVRAKALDGLKPIAGIGCGRIAALALIDRSGGYHRAVVTLDADLGRCEVSLSDADSGDLPDAVTEAGLILRPNAAGGLDVRSSGRLLTIDATLTDGRLIADPAGVFYVTADRVFRLSLGL
jgi:hypothetical protein